MLFTKCKGIDIGSVPQRNLRFGSNVQNVTHHLWTTA